MRALPTASPEQTEAALRAIDALRDKPDAPDAAMTLRQRGLAQVLRELLLGHQDCVALQRTVAEDEPLPDHLRVAARSETLSVPYRDPVRALLVLLPVALAFLLVFLYWTATGWDEGATAALMTLVAGLFASSSPSRPSSSCGSWRSWRWLLQWPSSTSSRCCPAFRAFRC